MENKGRFTIKDVSLTVNKYLEGTRRSLKDITNEKREKNKMFEDFLGLVGA